MMKVRDLRVGVAIAGLLIASGSCAAPAIPPKQTVYFYIDRHDHWCAAVNSSLFRKQSRIEGQYRIENEVGSVSYVGGKPVHAQAFLSDAEAESFLLIDYSMGENGVVRSAKLTWELANETGPGTQKSVYNYAVRNGTYLPQTPKAAEALKDFRAFRKITALSGLPVAPLLDRARTSTPGAPICAKKATPLH